MTATLKRTLRWSAIALLTVLTACSAARREDLGDLRKILRGRPSVTPTAAEVMARPYYQMQVHAPDSQALMILGGVEGARQDWYDSQGGVLIVEHGQIVRTIGIVPNLDDSHWLSSNPFAAGLQHLDAPFTGSRIADWSPGYRYGVRMDVTLTPAGMEDVSILGSVHHLRRIDERVSAPVAGFSALNHYWVDPADGLVWKSHQVVAPGIALDTLALRPYRGVSR